MTWRTLLVGGGWVSERVWFPRLDADHRFEVVGVVDPDPLVAHRFPTLRWWTDLGSVPEGTEDLAFVATPNALHCTGVIELLRRGTVVFVEKPTCLSLAELDEIDRAVLHHRGCVVTSTATRARADVRRLAEVVEAELGEVRTIEVGWTRAQGIPRPGGWFTNRALAGGGVLFDLGWHLLDVGLSLARGAEVVQAAGVASSAHLGRGARADWRMDRVDASLPIDVEDTFVGFVGTTGPGLVVDAAWASHASEDVSSVRVVGDDGVARLTTTFGFSPRRVAVPSLEVVQGGVARLVPLPPQPVGTEYDATLDRLVDVVTGARPDRGLAEARAILSAIELLYASALRR